MSLGVTRALAVASKPEGGIEGVGQLVEGNIALPLMLRGFAGLDGDANQAAGPRRNFADSVVGDVAGIVGVDDVLRRPAPRCQCRRKLLPVLGGVDFIERNRSQRGIVERPVERDGAVSFGRED